MSSVFDLLRKDLREDYKPYTSARSKNVKPDIPLDANENRYLGALKSDFAFIYEYPEPQPVALRRALSTLYEVSEDQLLITRGIDEGIELLIRSFTQPGKDQVLQFSPSYGYYEVAARSFMVEMVTAQYKETEKGYELPQVSLEESNVRVLFLCRPNNPTGHRTSLQEIQSLLDQIRGRAILAVDEAYQEFSQDESAVNLLKDHENVFVLRTLSKAWGMAGLRVGAILGKAEVLQKVRCLQAPYPIPSPSAREAFRLIESNRAKEFIDRQRDAIGRTREKWKSKLLALPMVERVYESDANFILLKVKSASDCIERAKENGILVRDRSEQFDSDHVRVAIGTESDLDWLLRSWSSGGNS